MTLQVGALDAADAPGVAALMRLVYGDDYPYPTYYDPAALLAANRAGDIVSAVARRHDGSVCGHVALYRSAPYAPALFEVGAAVVHPDDRGAGVLGALMAEITGPLAARAGASASFVEAVTNHVFSQRSGMRAGYLPCAFEPSLMPGRPRVTCLVAARRHAPRRATVFLPQRYASSLRACYAGLDDGLTFHAAATDAPHGATQMQLQRFESAGVTRLHVTQLGADLAARVATNDDAVVQVFLPLEAALVGWAAETLRASGFRFGGLMPAWLGGDALLLQRERERPDFATVELVDPRAKELLACIQADR